MSINEYDALIQDKGESVNEYDEIIDRMDQEKNTALRVSAKQSVDKDPQRQAEILGLSQRTGLPAPVIDRNFDAIKKRAQITDTDYSRMLQESPKLSSWVTDPENMALAKDDLPQLGMVEKAVQTLSDYAGSLASGAAAGIGSFAHGLSESIGIGGRMLRRAIENQITIDQSGIHVTPSPYRAEQFGTTIPGAADATQVALQEAAQAWNEMSRSAAAPPERQTVGTELASSVGQLVPILAAAYLAPEAVGPMLFSQGVSRMADMVEEDQASELRKDLTELGGGFVMEVVGRIGLGKILERAPLPVQNIVFRSLLNTARAGGIQAAEQLTIDVMNGVSRKVLTNPAAALLPPNELANVGMAFLTGGVVRGALEPIYALQARAQAKTQEQLITALTEGVTDSKTLELFPPKLQEFLREATKDGPIPNVYIPVEKWNEYFQSQKQDPARAAADAGIDRTAYEQAMATGSDLQVPTADYFTKVAPEHGAAFVKEIRLHPDQMNAREAEAYATALESEKPAAAPPPSGPEASAAQVREDIIGQMVGRGFDRTAVEAYAGLYESAFRTMGERAGVDPFQLYEPYRLRVTRPIPEILQSLGHVDAFDAMLDRLRSGDVPQQREMFGASLLEFLREKGGLIDEGGELKALEVDAGRKAFEKNLIQKEGLPLDRAREAAAEAGYIPKGGSVAEFLDAIDKEARGQPVYSQQAADPRKLEQTTMLQQLGDYLKAVGVDLKTASNEEIKQILNQAAIEPRTGQVLNQAAEPGRPIEQELQQALPIPDAIPLVQVESTQSFTNLDGKEIRKLAFAEIQDLAAKDPATNTHTGWKVNVSVEGLKKSANFAVRAEQAVALENIHALIKEGIYLRSAADRQDPKKGVPYDYLYAPFLYNGEMYVAKMALRKGQRGSDRTFYTLHAQKVSWPAGLSSDYTSEAAAEPLGAAAPSVTKATLFDFVNQARQTTPLFQQTAEGQRGAIRFGAERQFNIELLEKADLSTFLHESGHFFLEVFGDTVDELLARSGDLEATQQKMIEDYGALLKHLGVQDRSMIGTEQHEEFARTFEAYLREGKAPSSELRSIFSRFRAWLVSIYQSFKQLNVKLTPEVTGVMDRLLATDQEIAIAEQQAGIEAMFTDAHQAGMSEKEFAAYRETVQQASDRARDQLQRQMMDEYQRTRTDWWQAQRERVHDDVAREVHQQKEYLALAYLQKGTLPDGSPLPEGVEAVKLSKDALVEQYGKEFLKRLPKPYVYSREGGVAPEIVADLFGYSSGDELVKAIVNARPMNPLIEAETDSRMRDRHGDMLLDGSIAEKAREAVLTTGRSDIVRAELQVLAKKKREVAPFLEAGKQRTREGRAMLESVPPSSVVRSWAETRVAGMTVRDLQPNTYWVAARQAGRRALEAAAKDDFDTALTQKRKELLNVELYRATTHAREETQQTVEYLRSFGDTAKRERIGKAGGDYLDQIDGLLDRFDLAKISQKAADRRVQLSDWIAEQERQGHPLDIPMDIRNEARQQNYQTMTVEQLQGLRDSVRSIEHWARFKNRLLRRQAERELSTLAAEGVASIDRNVKGPRPTGIEPRLPGNERGRSIQSYLLGHLPLGAIVREIDGFHDGGFMFEHVMRPLDESGAGEAGHLERATAAVSGIYQEAYGGEESSLYHKQFIPEIQNSLSRMARIMAALNWGNETNRQRLMDGGIVGTGPLEETQVRAILDTLDARDWTFVQNVWDHINSYWPEIAAMHQRVTGVAPEKVEASPFQTRFGAMEGGYFPLAYEGRISMRAASNPEASFAKSIEQASYARAMTAHGHTEARVEGVRLPLRGDFGVVGEHLQQIIHDLTHREALIDIGRLLGRKDIQDAIVRNHGDIAYQEIKGNIRDIAIGRTPAPSWYRTYAAIRGRAVQARLGWNAVTGLMHLTNITSGMFRVGPGEVLTGLGQWFRSAGDAENTAAGIAREHEGMRLRWKHRMVELDEIRDQIGLNRGPWSSAIHDAAATIGITPGLTHWVADSYLYALHRIIQFAEIPTYLGARERAAREGRTPADASAMAYRAVLDSFGGGQIKDLARVQKEPLGKVFSTFMTYQLSAHRQLRELVKKDATAGRKLVDSTLLVAAPLALALGVHHVFKQRNEKESLAREFAGIAVDHALGMFVFVRELAGFVESPEYRGPASTGILGTLKRFAYQAGEGQLDKGLLKSANEAAGELLGFPAGQIDRTAEGVIEMMEGKTKDPSVLLVGPKK